MFAADVRLRINQLSQLAERLKAEDGGWLLPNSGAKGRVQHPRRNQTPGSIRQFNDHAVRLATRAASKHLYFLGVERVIRIADTLNRRNMSSL